MPELGKRDKSYIWKSGPSLWTSKRCSAPLIPVDQARGNWSTASPEVQTSWNPLETRTTAKHRVHLNLGL